MIPDGQLLPSGENLAGVLQKLQADFRLDEYTKLVRSVFPEILDLTPRPVDDSKLELYLWTRGEGRHRPELAISLRQSGRGIAPVLAILYVLFTATSRCTIIVDEPQSFLHPAALRRLLTIFNTYRQHQFILATHSPLVAAAANVQHCIVVRQHEGISTLDVIDATNVAGIRQLLSAVGASLTDVFGADRILWVEGPTEVHCFTRILQQQPELDLRGTVILALRSTDELRGRHARLAISLYDRLCHANALLPPVLAFEFDRELFSASDRDELCARTNGRAFFTKRRMYENYLLDPEAIAAVLEGLSECGHQTITPQTVSEWLTRAREKTPHTPEKWLQETHAANLLNQLFKEFTAGQCEYNKTTHGLQLTEWLLNNHPEALDDLASLLNEILGTIDRTQ